MRAAAVGSRLERDVPKRAAAVTNDPAPVPVTSVLLYPTANAAPAPDGAPETLHNKSVTPVFIDVHDVPLKRNIVPTSPVT